MKQRRGFYDLCVSPTSKTSLINNLTTLVELGYRTVAINQTVEESAFEQDKKKKRKADKEDSPIPPPMTLDDVPEALKSSLKILQRITVYFSTTDNAHKMVSSENIKKYDIIAVIPTSKPAFMHTCTTLDVDIISIDISNKMHQFMNRKLYNLAAERGMWFELPYGLGVLDSTARRNLIFAGHQYHAYGKSKNILISSGAQNPMQIRGPYDVVNMSLLLGLSEEQGKSAITNAGLAVILRAESRRRGKAVVCIQKTIPSQVGDIDDKNNDENLPAAKKMCIGGS